MATLRLRSREKIFKQIWSFILYFRYQWQKHPYFRLFLYVLLITSLISYLIPNGLLFTLKNISYVDFFSNTDSIRDQLINQQKREQKIAYEWFKNSRHYSNLISNQTNQSIFYDYIQTTTTINHDLPLTYKLLHKPKQNPLNSSDHIVISILYSKYDSNYREGKFYLGQLLYHLLKTYHSRFIITLCENNNTNHHITDEIKLIRKLLPVFIVNSRTEIFNNTYEREKQAHLQCILANFQSFPQINYLLLLQDDALPVSQKFYYQLSSLIDNRIKKQWPLNGQRQQPAFIKIYHPTWLIGYLHPTFYIISQLISTSFIITLIVFYFYQFFIQIKYPIQWQHSSRLSMSNGEPLSNFIQNNPKLMRFLFCFVLITLILISLNHPNVSWTWRSLHPSLYAIYPSPSCCLPGVIFFRETYLDIIEYLNSIECNEKYAIDTAFDDLRKYTQLRTYLVEPNLLHHIGVYSRLRQAYINPYLID